MQRAVIIGAGPAGLTAAWELLERTEVVPVVLERSTAMGGLSQTVRHAGNRIDIGGHRFFTKSDRVMDWWLDKLPLADGEMLVRSRKSRIFHGGAFFDYPLSPTPRTLASLGRRKSLRIGLSYLRARVRPIREERSLEDFLINRFGRELYETFFREYTEKVWGVPCTELSAEWGAQRIKGLDIGEALRHSLRSHLRRDGSLGQKDTETSLIEQFLYPRLGPGQLWERVADQIRERGGTLLTERTVDGFEVDGDRISAVHATTADGRRETHEADLVYSTMPIRGLMAGLEQAMAVPPEVAAIARGLQYRDFITVGLLLDELAVGPVPDNWIYVQEPGVKVGRIQVYNNWSPDLVADPDTTWLGLEYFCTEGDPLWTADDADLAALAIGELAQMGLARREALRDHVVLRMPKTYPAYTGTYARMDELRTWLDGLDNLVLLGRNGMHRYNNQDHSMLTAMTAVDNLVSGRRDRSNVWAVNTEPDYHEHR